MGRLDNRVAIVTGGGTGIGEAVCHKFVQEGARVIVSGMPGDPVAEVAEAIKRIGGEAVPFEADIADPAQAEACVQAALKLWGRLDILVNNSGVFLPSGDTDVFSVEVFDETVTRNIRSVFLMTRYALPHLVKSGGNIIATGSEAGMLGLPTNTPYGASKGWIHAFIKGVAAEQAKHGVRANCVCPGPVETGWTHRENGPSDNKTESTVVSATPLGRRGTPEEVANVFAFLASDMASYVTGALWTVDGGTVISKGTPGTSPVASGDDDLE